MSVARSNVTPLPIQRAGMSTHSRPIDACSGSGPGPLQEWIATQIRVLEFWREQLIAQGGEWRLIALLDQHAAFLREAGEL